jgi:hypothetical protein
VLESRCVPTASASVINGVLTVQTGSGDESITIQVDSNDYTQIDVVDNGSLLLKSPFASFTSISVNGGGGNDNLTLDYSSGSFSQGVQFDGGSGTSSLTLANGDFDEIVDALAGPGSSNLSLTPDPSFGSLDTVSGSASGSSNPVAWTVNTSNVNTVHLDSAPDFAGNLSFDLPDGTDNAVLQDDGTPNNEVSQLASLNGTFATTNFTDPSFGSSLALNFGGGTTVTVNALDTQYAANLVLNDGGAGNDTVNFAAPFTTGNGDAGALTVDAGTVNVNAPITVQAPSPSSNFGPNPVSIQFNNSGPLVLAADIISAANSTDVSSISFGGPVTLAGDCTLMGQTVAFAGALNLGTNTLQVPGNLELMASATLTTQLTGTGSDQYGRVQCGSSVHLNSAGIAVALGPAFVPANGTEFSLLTAVPSLGKPGLSGLFSAGSFVMTDGLTFGVDYQPDVVDLTTGAGPADHVAFVQQPNAGADGQPLSPTVTLAVEDALGNVVTTDNSTVTVAVSSGPGNLGGIESGTTVKGIASFSDLILSNPGTYTLQANDGFLKPGTSMPIIVGAGPPSRLAFESSPTTSVAGQALPDFSVALTDAFGTAVTGAPVTVGITGIGGTLFGNTTVDTSNQGMATFTGLLIRQAGQYSLSVTSPGVGPITSTSIDVTPGAPASLVIQAAPGGGTAGQTLANLDVQVTDSFGNAISDVRVTVRLTGLGGTLFGNTSVTTSAQGLASFTGLSIQQAGQYSLSLATPGVAPVTSAAINISPAASAGLVIESAPSGGMAGQALPDVRVEVRDAYGNPAADGTPVTLIVSGVDVPAPVTVPTTGGVAMFSGLVLAQAGGYTFTVSTPGASPAFVVGVTITATPAATGSPRIGSSPGGGNAGGSGGPMTLPGPPAQVQYASVPIVGRAGKVLPALRLQVRDAAGLPASEGIIVRLRLRAGHLSGHLQARTDARGEVTFTGLSIARTGRYTLLIAVSGVKASFVRSLTILRR